MHRLVDIVRLSPEPEGTLDWLRRFRENIRGKHPIKLTDEESNGYWNRLAGMLTVET
ncbi:MAG: hypothetical protein LRY66_05770 [Saccharospirillaceae bacterium]|nr:hypothetical protein [Saccharospirillaceae bacterium]